MLFILFYLLSSSAYSLDDQYLNYLLNIKSEKYNKNIEGKAIYDELAEYKDVERLYLETRNQAIKKQAKTDDIKYFSFIGFVAYNSNDAATKEAMLSDFIQVYYANRENLLSVLDELPFLIPSSCYYIGKHFGFEGKFTNDKEPFMKENKVYIKKALSKDNAEKCLFIISSKHW